MLPSSGVCVVHAVSFRGLGSAGSVGATSIGVGNGKSLAIAVDPSDPSVAIHYGGGDVVSDVVVAGSVQGRIPFTPATQPTAITDTFYGNLFAQASVGFVRAGLNDDTTR